MAVAVFGIFTGVGLFHLKTWARISALVWAGIIAFFSALILSFLPFIPLSETSAGLSVPAVHLKVLMYLAYGIPLISRYLVADLVHPARHPRAVFR
jgi:hypothetical protein